MTGGALSERILTPAALDAALAGGLLLSAGGSGRAAAVRNRRLGEAASVRGPIRLVPIDALDPAAEIVIATAVGAPGGAKRLVEPEHSVTAVHMLIEASGCRPAGVIPGHVPGMYAWLVAAALGIPLVDAACNGRGHPTVKMGSLGLASRDDVSIFQCCAGTAVRVTAHGSSTVTANVMRAAAIQNEGLVMACRGPLRADFVRRHGALAAIGHQLSLGAAMLAAAPGMARIEAAVRHLQGSVLAVGEVTANTVAYRDGFDVGHVTVRDGNGELALGVYNELMTAERDGARVATFPDLIASLDPQTGDPVAVSELVRGSRVAVVTTSKRNLALGAGVLDPSVYPEVERGMGAEIARYALDFR